MVGPSWDHFISSQSRVLANTVNYLIQNKILSRMQVKLQNKMFNSLVNMDLANLLAESPAALATRFSADIELIRGFHEFNFRLNNCNFNNYCHFWRDAFNRLDFNHKFDFHLFY